MTRTSASRREEIERQQSRPRRMLVRGPRRQPGRALIGNPLVVACHALRVRPRSLVGRTAWQGLLTKRFISNAPGPLTIQCARQCHVGRCATNGWRSVAQRKWRSWLDFGAVATWANPAAPIPNCTKFQQLLFSKQCFGGERIQMIPVLADASATTEITLIVLWLRPRHWAILQLGMPRRRAFFAERLASSAGRSHFMAPLKTVVRLSPKPFRAAGPWVKSIGSERTSFKLTPTKYTVAGLIAQAGDAKNRWEADAR